MKRRGWNENFAPRDERRGFREDRRMSSLRQQCDFMSNVVRHAILLGMNREQFDKLAETAWLVLTAEPAPEPEATEFWEPTPETRPAPCCDINASYPGKHRGGCPGEETPAEPESFGLEINGELQDLKNCPRCKCDFIGGASDKFCGGAECIDAPL